MPVVCQPAAQTVSEPVRQVRHWRPGDSLCYRYVLHCCSLLCEGAAGGRGDCNDDPRPFRAGSRFTASRVQPARNKLDLANCTLGVLRLEHLRCSHCRRSARCHAELAVGPGGGQHHQVRHQGETRPRRRRARDGHHDRIRRARYRRGRRLSGSLASQFRFARQEIRRRDARRCISAPRVCRRPRASASRARRQTSMASRTFRT